MSENEKKDFEPVKIRVQPSLYDLLVRDAADFEDFTDKNGKIQMGRFVNALVLGYYGDYKSELARQKESLRVLLSPYIRNRADLNAVIDQLITDSRKEESGEKEKKSALISFRPWERVEQYAVEIENAADSRGMSLSEYYLNMLQSYVRKPVYERERYILSEQVDMIHSAMKGRKTEELSFTTREKPLVRHTVLPYRLVRGADGQFNYLICQEKEGKRYVPRSFRLCRLQNLYSRSTEMTLDPKVKQCLDEMAKYDPRYVISKPVKTCVEFTDKGLKDFRRIYLGRPEMVPVKGNKYQFTTSCSYGQVYDYFKRFNPGEFTIIEPEDLKRKLIRFHKKHVEGLE